MNLKAKALAVSLLTSAFLLSAHALSAQGNPPPATATRPAKSPDQTSTPNNAPAATPSQTTGQGSQDPTTRRMNQDAKSKVEREGK
ncbi:hypothetical protein [Bradyrhizobium sp. STM 3562]|uniref:hypothetical protein n=1 Tax=Bradyrhizobium sp. STM 3562 TaxID=578924 RepID=UPI00388E4C6A